MLAASNRPLRPAGQFNQSRVVARGKTVEHWLNGTKVLQYELESPALKAAIAKSKFKDVARFGTPQKGHLLLQDHGDAVCYREHRGYDGDSALSRRSATTLRHVHPLAALRRRQHGVGDVVGREAVAERRRAGLARVDGVCRKSAN